MYEQKPWLRFYGDVPATLTYPDATMYESLMRTVNRYPEAPAYDFMGRRASYRAFAEEINRCAGALAELGLKQGDRITISMPTSPQGIICFYAANKLGAAASMIHPLSTAKEIEFYLTVSESAMALTLDAFYGKFAEVLERTKAHTLILTRIGDYLPPLKRLGFYLAKGRKIPPVPADRRVRWWRDLMGRIYPEVPPTPLSPDDPAVILYSGGTTGIPKGIMLSNRNFISEGMQVAAWGNLGKDASILAILPIFHGFGLGVCINAAFMGGGMSILVPTFTAATVAQLIKKKKPSFMVGVPTLYDALTRDPVFARADLSCFRATFSGADHLPRQVKERFEAIVRRRGGTVKLLEGYGLTEAVTAIMAMPLSEYREGSIGIPFPDMLAKVVKTGTTEEAPTGEDGELCIHGPAVMLGYLNQPEETAQALRKHDDGKIWLHTGDLASMDSDGFFYFKLRLKRMIKSSGFNVYPSQVEEVLCRHSDVAEACVIGIPDEQQVERVKAFVVLKDPSHESEKTKIRITEHCRNNLIKWSCPREIEFRRELPKTRIGKVAFRELEEEELAKLKESGQYTGR